MCWNMCDVPICSTHFCCFPVWQSAAKWVSLLILYRTSKNIVVAQYWTFRGVRKYYFALGLYRELMAWSNTDRNSSPYEERRKSGILKQPQLLRALNGKPAPFIGSCYFCEHGRNEPRRCFCRRRKRQKVSMKSHIRRFMVGVMAKIAKRLRFGQWA